MDPNEIKDYFSKESVVLEYARASINVGLWNSEKIILQKYFSKEQKLLELGCGTGRIAQGMYRLGYHNITATDFSPNMIDMAKNISEEKNYKISYEVEDATKLSFPNEIFDGAIFGFNGLMQIPTKEARGIAISQICRVIKKNSYFIFTTHDREVDRNYKYWTEEKKIWDNGRKKSSKQDEFGDICYHTPHGELFIHSPSKNEILESMKKVNFELIFCNSRKNIASENEAVIDFSDDCLFWVFKKL